MNYVKEAKTVWPWTIWVLSASSIRWRATVLTPSGIAAKNSLKTPMKKVAWFAFSMLY